VEACPVWLVAKNYGYNFSQLPKRTGTRPRKLSQLRSGDYPISKSTENKIKYRRKEIGRERNGRRGA